jgi:hypothetical protein
MAWVEVRFSEVDLPVQELDQLEARLVDLFKSVLGDEMRSDIRINIWKPVQARGGELTPMEASVLIDEVLRAIYSVSGPLRSETKPLVEFVMHPKSQREEIEKKMAELRSQLSEHPLHSVEANRLEALIHELESLLATMPDEDQADAA